MARIVLIHRVEDVKKWKSFDAECMENLGAFASEVRSYFDPKGGESVAVAMNVTDPEGLQAFMQSDACAAIMQRHGVVQPVTTLTAGD